MKVEMIAQKDIPADVIEPYDAQQTDQDTIALLELLAISEKDKADGNFLSKEQLLTEL